MRFTTKVFLTRALSDMRTILFFVVVASILSTMIGFAAGYERGVHDASEYFISLLGE